MQPVQFQNTKNHLFAGEYTIPREYEFDRNIAYLRFKSATVHFLGFLKLVKLTHLLKVYIVKWIKFIADVCNKYEGEQRGHITVDDLDFMSVEEFLDFMRNNNVNARLGVENYIFNEPLLLINTWGTPYWTFLHYTSFCVYKDVRLTNNLAYLLLNFHLLLLCGACSYNYKMHNPLQTITIPMVQTSDPITIMYDFHNRVNKFTGSNIMSLDEFARTYTCQYEGERKILYNVSIEY